MTWDHFDTFGEIFYFDTFKNHTFENDTFESLWVDYHSHNVLTGKWAYQMTVVTGLMMDWVLWMIGMILNWRV